MRAEGQRAVVTALHCTALRCNRGELQVRAEGEEGQRMMAKAKPAGRRPPSYCSAPPRGTKERMAGLSSPACPSQVGLGLSEVRVGGLWVGYGRPAAACFDLAWIIAADGGMRSVLVCRGGVCGTL